MLCQSVSRSHQPTVGKPRLAALLAALLCAASSYAAGLNDTGQTQCYDGSYVPLPCNAAVGGDAGVLPRQDARYGRDPHASSGGVSKIGAGDAGFDFSKIANNGATLAATAALGSNASDWACTRDNVTGLVWEVKTSSGLRSDSHTYTWYSADASTNGGNAGALGTNTCGGTLAPAPDDNQCNTQNFVAAVNAVGLCGANDWRLPTRRELLTIVNAGRVSPSIDSVFFPNTTSVGYSTASTYTGDPAYLWYVQFLVGKSDNSKNAPYFSKQNFNESHVRLVRGGP